MNERTDDQLIATLGDAIRRADPVPENVLAGARAAFTWRTIDAELAELVFDSASELTGVRSETSPRQVTFQAPGVEIEVMVIENGQRRIVGQLIPPSEVTIQLASGDSVAETQTDDLGRFTFDDVQPGPVRLSVLGSSGEDVVHTEWILL